MKRSSHYCGSFSKCLSSMIMKSNKRKQETTWMFLLSTAFEKHRSQNAKTATFNNLVYTISYKIHYYLSLASPPSRKDNKYEVPWPHVRMVVLARLLQYKLPTSSNISCLKMLHQHTGMYRTKESVVSLWEEQKNISECVEFKPVAGREKIDLITSAGCCSLHAHITSACSEVLPHTGRSS